MTLSQTYFRMNHLNQFLQATALLLVILAYANVSSAQIHINEFSASNLNSFTDRLGKTDDWIELYNSSNNPIEISGYHISDKASKPMKWAIPEGAVIQSKDFFIVHCSGRDTVQYGEYHTNFKLSQTTGKDIVLLSDQFGNVIESFELDITLVEHSWCRSVDGGEDWMMCTTPTYGSTNNGTPQYDAYSISPGMDLQAGFYNGSQTISLINYEPNAEIRYTVDGTNPTSNSPLYTGPITIEETTVIKAKSFSPDPFIFPSKMNFNTYFIDEDFSLPVFSVAADEVIDLANGEGQLRPVGSLEYFNINKERETTSFGSLNRHGRDSWALDHRSLDWISRDEMGYSKAIDAKLFAFSDRDEYQKIMWRNSGDDNYPASGGGVHSGAAHIRDEYVHSLAQLGNIEVDVRSVQRVILFLNGQYWGVYGMRDRPVDHDYTDYFYDQGKYELQYLSTWGRTTIQYGGGKAHNEWVALRNFILSNDMSVPENYAIAEDSINMVSLIDYMLTNLNVVASDWLNYNTGWWRGLNPDGQHKKWGYILWDLDATFDYYINYSGVPNTNADALACDIEDIADFMDSFFSWSSDLIPSDPGPIPDPANCNSILNGSSPYAADDPFFITAVEAYNPCCENWTAECNSLDYYISLYEGELLVPSEFNGNHDVGQHEKIFLKLLDESPEFKQLYYGRYADLMSTVFTCENMTSVLDSMIATITPEMPRQIDRWGGSMSEWQSNVQSLKDFIRERCELLDDGALECYDELTGPYDVTLMVSPNIGIGEIDFNELDIEEFPWLGQYFGGTMNEIKAKVFDEFSENYVFSHWESSSNNSITPSPLDRRAFITLTQNDTLTAVFVTNNEDLDGDGFVSDVDCDDANANIFPGAEEICDNIDNNCDGQIDEGLALAYYQDLDGDGFGDPEISITSCTGQVGYTLNNTDCDDNNMNINPGATEICDGLDNNCDGQIDENILSTYYADNDGDGFGDPNDSLVDCTSPQGYTLNNTDCDDNDASINEAAIEIPNNGIDENCDGMDEVTGEDVDGDGYFSDVDCNDNNANINPGATEVCDGVDNNCNGEIDEGLMMTIYADEDGDGYGNLNNALQSCELIPGYSLNNTDCDDSNEAVNPESVEICDSADNNCDGQIDEGLIFETYYTDNDNDGFGTGEGFQDCNQPLQAVSMAGDCDDNDPTINPNATDIPNNDIDEDCDGVIAIIDLDNDVFNSDEDCDDSNPDINPDAIEISGNGIDEDCDGIDGGSAVHNLEGLTVTIFPNPVDELLTIETNHTQLSYELLTLSGELIMKNQLGSQIYLKEIPAGFYLLKILSKEESNYFVHKLVKI